jgi:DNA-binding XRE family transcriptional regulator
MTQVELAATAGVNRMVIWQIESGQMLPGPEVEIAIKRALRWPERAEDAFAILAEEEAA